MDEPARYFPVKAGPLRMKAGLMRLGTDFGNGAADGRFFQMDTQYGWYMREKRAVSGAGMPRYRRHGVLAETEAQARAHDAVLAWLRDTVNRELPAPFPPQLRTEVYLSAYDEIARNVQEDLAVVQRTRAGAGAGTDALIMAHVCLPGGWRSDAVLGRSFQQIHAPVPDFAGAEAAAASMVASMVERGPYVRFVWSLCADDHLDHHPEHGERRPWDEQGRAGWLRVERQVTVPFPAVDASLFIIRTYVYPFASLTGEQRATLAAAVEQMPAEVRRYKGLDADRARIARALQHHG